MRKVILLLLLLPVVTALDEQTLFTRSSAVIAINLTGNVGVEPNANARLDFLTVDLAFFPKHEGGQIVESLQTSMPAQVFTDKVRFQWDSPRVYTFDYGVNTVVRTHSNPGVFSYVSYPIDIAKIPSQYRQYLRPTELVDSDHPAVREVAKRFQNEKDLWVLASNVAIWVRDNIKYNLSTLNVPASKSASWVLNQEEGVCAELTTLFVAIMRSLGVPARFVSGIAYTNSDLFPLGWGGHAWAEVFFPDYGWIPFDVTFGEFGWINPGHVKTLTSLDATDPSTKFKWRGHDVQLRLRPLDIRANVISLGGKDPAFVRISMDVAKNYVGPGSYSLLVIDVENLQRIYQTVELRLANVKELIPLATSKYVILKPLEKKKVYWAVRVTPSLAKGFQYQIPLLVYTTHNETARSHLTAREDGFIYDIGDVTKEQALLQEEMAKSVEQVSLDCKPDKPFVYSYETVLVHCTAKSLNPLPKTELCMQDCTDFSGQASLPLFYTRAGFQEITATLRGQDVLTNSRFMIEMLDTPEVAVVGLKKPDVASFSRDVPVSLTLVKKSVGAPEQVHAVLSWPGHKQTVSVEKLRVDQPVLFNIPKGTLNRRTTLLQLDVTWQDKNEKEYSYHEQFIIRTKNVSWYQHIYLFFRDFFRSIGEVFSD